MGAKMILLLVGWALVGAALVWGCIIGFYPNQLPLLIGLGVVGGVLCWISDKMPEPDRSHQDA